MRAFPRLAMLLIVCPTIAHAANPVVRITTTLGAFDLELCAEASAVCAGDTPATVANFLRYVDENRYPSTTFVDFHSISPDPIAFYAGRYYTGTDASGDYYDFIPTLAPIALDLDPQLSNVRGSVAMIHADPPNVDTATSWWLINVTDNPSFDVTLGGFAVFGQVVAGMDVVDAIASLPIYPYISGALPLSGYPGEPTPALPYLVYLTKFERVPVPEPEVEALGLGGAAGLAALAARRSLGAARRARRDYVAAP